MAIANIQEPAAITVDLAAIIKIDLSAEPSFPEGKKLAVISERPALSADEETGIPVMIMENRSRQSVVADADRETYSSTETEPATDETNMSRLSETVDRELSKMETLLALIEIDANKNNGHAAAFDELNGGMDKSLRLIDSLSRQYDVDLRNASEGVSERLTPGVWKNITGRWEKLRELQKVIGSAKKNSGNNSAPLTDSLPRKRYSL